MMLAAVPMSPPIVEARSRRDAFVELEKVTHTYGRGDKQVWALDETNLLIEKGDFSGVNFKAGLDSNRFSHSLWVSRFAELNMGISNGQDYLGQLG